MPVWTADVLLAAFGIALSLAQWLIPSFKKFQEETLGDWTPLFSAGVFLIISVGALVINCSFVWPCIVQNAPAYWSVFASAIVTYYGSYHALVKPAKLATVTPEAHVTPAPAEQVK